MQCRLVRDQAGQGCLAIRLVVNREVAKPLAPLAAQVAADPDLVDCCCVYHCAVTSSYRGAVRRHCLVVVRAASVPFTAGRIRRRSCSWPSRLHLPWLTRQSPVAQTQAPPSYRSDGGARFRTPPRTYHSYRASMLTEALMFQRNRASCWFGLTTTV